MIAEVQGEIDDYIRQVETGPPITRDRQLSWLRRFEETMRRVYATVTWTRGTDALPPRASQRAPRTQVNPPRPRATQMAAPRPPPPYQPGSSAYQQPPPNQPGSSTWQAPLDQSQQEWLLRHPHPSQMAPGMYSSYFFKPVNMYVGYVTTLGTHRHWTPRYFVRIWMV